MTTSQDSVKVLRLAVLVDGRVVDDLHQQAPGSVDVGTGLANKVMVFDGRDRRVDLRRWAPLCLVLGLVVFAAGTGLFGWEVAQQRQLAAEAVEQGVTLSTFAPSSEHGTGGLGLILALLALVPLATAFVGFQEGPSASPRQDRLGRAAPTRFPLFVYRDGRYRLDLPPELQGKISLGRNTVTVARLRAAAHSQGRLSVELGRRAKGKLLLGESTILFQLVPPAPVPPRPAFPAELRDPLQHLRLGGLTAATLGGCALLLGGFFVSLNFVEPTVGEPDARFLDAMEIPHATFDDAEEEPEEPEEEEPAEDVLVQKDEKKVDEKVLESDKRVLAEAPETFSHRAVEQARGVGIARVLGTYGGPGEGTVLDVIQGTENDLGALFDAGMTQTVMSNGGDITAFVAGGKGISATGSLTGSSGLVTSSEGEADIGRVDKLEKKITGRLQSNTTDIYGDVDKKAVQATIRRRMSALQHCYEKALRSQPDLRGKMSFTIAISTIGRVTSVVVEEDSLGDGGVKACTVAKIQGWRFPSEGAEEASEVTFSVVFSGAS